MSGKILIVDDDQSMCETLAAAMSEIGFIQGSCYLPTMCGRSFSFSQMNSTSSMSGT